MSSKKNKAEKKAELDNKLAAADLIADALKQLVVACNYAIQYRIDNGDTPFALVPKETVDALYKVYQVYENA